MRTILFLFIISLSLTSCFDVSMDVNVDSYGQIAYEGDFDLSSMMPLMMMAMEMSPDTAAEEDKDKFTELLKQGEAIDTILSISDMEEGLNPDDELVQKMNEQFKIRMQMDRSSEKFRLSFRSQFDDLEMQKQFTEMMTERKSEESSGLMGGMGDDDVNFDAMFIDQLDLEKGLLVYKTVLKQQEDDEMMSEMNPFGPSMEPNMKINLTVPGKIKSVDGAEYKMKDDWTATIRIPMETDDPAKQFVRVYFEPDSIYSRPEVTELWEPKPEKITFAGRHGIPSDATVLIGEEGPQGWVHMDGSDLKWIWDGYALTVNPGTGDIRTTEAFGDCQLHIEWRIPFEEGRSGQGKGNSGIFLQSRYEVQVLDSYDNTTYSNGQAGSIYKQYIPAVNASKAPGEWQVYDIIYKAPRFNELGGIDESARITVIHNGVIIHNDREIKGTTEYIGLPKNIVHGDAPLKLQDHSNKVSYRNVWVRKL